MWEVWWAAATLQLTMLLLTHLIGGRQQLDLQLRYLPLDSPTPGPGTCVQFHDKRPQLSIPPKSEATRTDTGFSLSYGHQLMLMDSPLTVLPSFLHTHTKNSLREAELQSVHTYTHVYVCVCVNICTACGSASLTSVYVTPLRLGLDLLLFLLFKSSPHFISGDLCQ